jgi:hypothetical protein
MCKQSDRGRLRLGFGELPVTARLQGLAMFDLEFAIRALALAALALFLTPASALGLSARSRRFVRRAAIALLTLAIAAAIGATLHWFLKGERPAEF